MAFAASGGVAPDCHFEIMTQRPERAADEVIDELTALRQSQRSVILATVGTAGSPEASYAPYVCDETGNFYIFVSRLAQHTRNLETLPEASLLFIEPEHTARQIFARRRLTYRCAVLPIAAGTPEWTSRIELMRKYFGAVVSQLSGLADFRLFRLQPFEGRYVRGFGQAFQWRRAGQDVWTLIGPEARE